MTAFKVLRTNHTSFTVSDLDRSLGFFRDTLGVEVTSKAPRDPALLERIVGVPGAAMMIGYVQGPGHRLELIEYRGPADRGAVVPRPCDISAVPPTPSVLRDPTVQPIMTNSDIPAIVDAK